VQPQFLWFWLLDQCCNAKSDIPDHSWLNVTLGYSKEGLCYTKGKPCIGDCIDCCCQFKNSLRAQSTFFRLSHASFSPSKNNLHLEVFLTRWLRQSTTFQSGGEVWTMIFTHSSSSESWWISRLCPLRCAVHVIYVFQSRTSLLSWALGICMSSTDESVILQNRPFSLLWLHIQTHNP